jgi:hypothetical protein
MYEAAECRKRAERCVQRANELGISKSQQKSLIQFAAQWIELAEHADYVDSLAGEAMQESAVPITIVATRYRCTGRAVRDILKKSVLRFL